MKLQKKAKRLLAKFDKVLAKLKSLGLHPEEDKYMYYLSALEIIQKLETVNCDFMYLELNTVNLLQEISEQGIKSHLILNTIFDIVFRFLAHPEVGDLNYMVCYDTYFLECSNVIKYVVNSNYRLVDYVLSELLDDWEVHDSEVNRHMFENFKVLLSFGITTDSPTKCFVGETELTPHLLVDLLILSLDLYYNHITGNCQDDLYEEDTAENRAIIIETFKDCIVLSLRALLPISDAILRDRCLECGVEEAEVGEAIEMLKPAIPQIEERLGNKVSPLKHLCRCAVRQRLHQNWALPNGMLSLELPDTLKEYLDLRRD